MASIIIIAKCILFFYIVKLVTTEFTDNKKYDSFDVDDSENKARVMNISSRRNTSPISQHPSWDIFASELDVDCGESSSDRIIGGVDASLGQYPWIARLGYITPSNRTPTFKCGGSLISKQYVVTAAHCLKTSGIRLSVVRLGDYNILDDIDCVNDLCAEQPQDFAPEKIMWHRHFNKPFMNNDIGLIRLNGFADYNGWVLPICLPTGSIGEKLSGSAEVAGWGIMDMFTNERATILQTISMPMLPTETCIKNYKYTVKVTKKQICAGGKLDEDSCGGDSGGPLMKIYDGDLFPQYYLLGIVSFGPTSCGSEIPGVYTNVHYYMRWILDNMEN